MRLCSAAFMLLGLAGLVGCGSSGVDRRTTGRDAQPGAGAGRSGVRTSLVPWPDSVLQAMTLEQKVGQMVMITVPGSFTSDGSHEENRATALIRDWSVGGITVMRGDVYGGAMMVNRLQRLARFPLLVSADLERGLSMRLTRGTSFPDPMAIGATGDPALAYEAGRITAEEARAVGILQNFAPVVDVNTNARNPVINTRSFGDALPLVNAMAGAFIRGTRDAGGLATAKHFPGHGATGEDSHLQLPVLGFSRERLDSLEFAPFRSAADSGVDAIMVGHVALPGLDDSGLPASLSRTMVSGVLREDFGFGGLIITDAMDMAGARIMPPGRAVVTAVKAGVDIVLLIGDEHAMIQALRDAVRSGEIPMRRIDESVLRILKAKHRLGLHMRRTVALDSISAHVGTPEHWQAARQVAERAVTLLRNDGDLLPLARGPRRRVLSLMLTDTDDGRTEVHEQGKGGPSEQTGASFTRQLRRYRLLPETLRLTPSSSREDLERALKKMRTADLVLVSLFVRVRTSSGRIGLPGQYAEFLRQANLVTTPSVLIAFGDPYTVADWTAPRAVLCAYSDAEVMVEAVAGALFGERPVTGRIPVSITGGYPAGSGLLLGTPQPAGADTLHPGAAPRSMEAIDTLVQKAIRDSVFPGAQLVVIRDNDLLLNRCYGRFTYDPASRRVDDSTLYDLASLTKVVSTTPALMKLYDEGTLELDDTVAAFVPQFAAGGKAGVTVRQLLLHRGGLPPFRKLWEFSATPTAAADSALATPLIARPGDSTIYSDLGMITLGHVVQHLARMALDEYVREQFFKPLGMQRTTFNPPAALQAYAAPTEYDGTWRKTLVCGSVHDENAALLGGVSGHAGLFSTAADLARYVAMLMNGGCYHGVRFLNPSTIRAFVGERLPAQERWLGWDMKSPTGSSAGTLFSGASFGHTGFTGTSIWVDPERRLAVILLTNRVYPTRANTKIFRFRPVLHDAILRALS